MVQLVRVADNNALLFEKKNLCKSLLCIIWILYHGQTKLSQKTLFSLNSAIETLENGVNYVQS